MKLVLDIRSIRESKLGVPTGYTLPNGVVVVWVNGAHQHNIATLVQARDLFPTLNLLELPMPRCPECGVIQVIPSGHGPGCSYAGKDMDEITKPAPTVLTTDAARVTYPNLTDRQLRWATLMGRAVSQGRANSEYKFILECLEEINNLKAVPATNAPLSIIDRHITTESGPPYRMGDLGKSVTEEIVKTLRRVRDDFAAL